MNEWHVPAIASVICLYLISLMSFAALVHRGFRDNWLQTLGLVGLILWALGRATVLDDKLTVSFYQFFGHLSLAVYGVGTLLKFRKDRKD